MTSRSPRAMFESLEARRLLATFIVDSTIDEFDGDFGEGDFSLREAIDEANNAGGDDTITFAPGLAGGTISLTGGQLLINDGLSISGLGTGQLSISANDASRIFNIDDGTAGASIAVSVSGLTLTRGSADNGGAIRNAESLTLTGIAFTDNTSTENGGAVMNLAALVVNSCTFTGNNTISSGGGIHSEPGSTLSVVNSTFTGNTAGGGGGIRNLGAAAVSDSTFIQNTSNGIGGRGGGICSADGSTLVMNGGLVTQNNAPSGGGVSTTGTITLFNVTISNNTSTLNGGGVVSFPGGTVTLEGTTLSGNIAGANGGGISVHGPLTVRNSTITGNAATDSGGGIHVSNANTIISNSTIVFNGAANGLGGGIFLENGAMAIDSTIVATNAFGTPAAPQEIVISTGGVVMPASGNNLIGHSGSSGGLADGVNGNIVGADPRLGPLAQRGGGVPTHALLPGSAAINAGSNPASLTTDQRGYPRVGGTAPDIGAYETGVFSTQAAPGRLVSGAADAGNFHRVATVNRDGAILVFEQDGSVTNLQEELPAPNATDDLLIWVDPKDNLTYIAAPSDVGLILYTLAADGSWSFRNLNTETGATAIPTGNLTQFTSTGGIVVIAGTTATGRLIGFQQNGTTAPAGGPGFAFVDISAQVEANGGTTPTFTELLSYVPYWDAWHLAGIDQNGDVQAVWLHIPGGQITTWRQDNLSDLTGAPPITGQLAVTLTPWGGMNLTGQDANGELITTWWVPGMPGWLTNNLTDDFGGVPLTEGKVSGYTTPWGGLNYAGIAEDGTTTVYWWAPGMDVWAVSPLLPAATPPANKPAGTLTSSSSAAGTLNVYGTSATGEVLRMWWQPGLPEWTSDNLTVMAG